MKVREVSGVVSFVRAALGPGRVVCRTGQALCTASPCSSVHCVHMYMCVCQLACALCFAVSLL
jgi:hypothetical protein